MSFLILFFSSDTLFTLKDRASLYVSSDFLQILQTVILGHALIGFSCIRPW